MSKVKSAAAAAPPSPPKVLLSADRVTFTVESGIKIGSRETMHSKQTALASDGPEALWLKEFTQYVRTDHRQRESPESRRIDWAKFGKPGYKPWTPPEVQAFYHSSVLPLPSEKGIPGDNSNGLVCACLLAFKEVGTYAMHAVRASS
jgi:hypothetical protein